MRLTLLLVVLINLTALRASWAQTNASTQTVYRCGNLYADQPCPDAQTLELKAIGAQRVRERQKQTQQDHQQAQDLQRQRETNAQRLQQQSKKTGSQERAPATVHTDSPTPSASKRVIQPSFKARSPKEPPTSKN
jgi:uncharacterized protein with von Willebrand factor type A (vWA) domain